jgi:NDP-sugar pyrophosphorylase family protein
MTAVVLAGGKGTRLAPYTRILPKPLMPIGDVPILEILIRQFKRAGVTDVILTVGHMAGLIRTYFGDGSEFGVNITYSYEDEPLGTAGPLAAIRDQIEDDHVLVTNGDVLTDFDFAALFAQHAQSGAVASIAAFQKKVKIDLGVLQHEGDDRLTGYIEKPSYDFLVSMGIYMFRREVLDTIPVGTHLDFPDLILQLLAKQEFVRLHKFGGYWQDLGRREDYEAANEDTDRLEAILNPTPRGSEDRPPAPRPGTNTRPTRRTTT